ncbi:type II toxin-antitoxin system RelE/ParE family toxin [Arenibacter sp. GZD96]|uniref:type II toxin-antitoxin system RelE/ParE family toxin n=1 Tax=Aurantibrevibacter litoralis TaxID=3106030 RepID=UPI002AFF9813|nr:type II toxin-antitoxin system RelE/ParE family toxin [Arenibacter sp. GZD-96]MEA1786103.1 type II toxin-antitoxin system RelE/ParE family toxin [Arenibacter sp. GZD-96]
MERRKERLVMGHKIKLLPIAHMDLRKAKKWYHEKSETLAQEFKAEVNKEIDYIGEYPEHYQRKYKELRQSLVTRFPYAIFYLVEEEQKQIVVFGILHTSRNPEIARKRTGK